jgi:hypothetical protein
LEISVSNYPLGYGRYIRLNSSFTTYLKIGDLKLASRILFTALWNKKIARVKRAIQYTY